MVFCTFFTSSFSFPFSFCAILVMLLRIQSLDSGVFIVVDSTYILSCGVVTCAVLMIKAVNDGRKVEGDKKLFWGRPSARKVDGCAGRVGTLHATAQGDNKIY